VQWYRDWLARASASAAGRATLWLLGDAFVASEGDNPLVREDMGVTLAQQAQTLFPYPEISGGASFTWASGETTDFADDRPELTASMKAILKRWIDAQAEAPVARTEEISQETRRELEALGYIEE